MWDDIIIYVLLGAAPALLWSFPKTRRMTGSWMTALKTVPTGCLVIFLLPTLIIAMINFVDDRWELFPSRSATLDFFFTAVLVLSVAVGIWLIIYLACLIWRKYEAVGKRSWLPFVFIFVVLVIGSGILTVVLSFAEYANAKGSYHGRWSTVRLPVEGSCKIAFQERVIHPFLAEYDYRLRFDRDGKITYCNLITNTGGETYFNLYRLRDGRLYLVDKGGDYIVDPAKAEVQYVFRDNGKLYATPYSQGESGGEGYSTGNDNMFFGPDNQKHETYLLSDELDGKTYYGCISYDFYPAAEKREISIDQYWKQDRF